MSTTTKDWVKGSSVAQNRQLHYDLRWLGGAPRVDHRRDTGQARGLHPTQPDRGAASARVLAAELSGWPASGARFR